jgi:hypothetical protein
MWMYWRTGMSFMRWGSKTILQVLHAKGDRGIVETYIWNTLHVPKRMSTAMSFSLYAGVTRDPKPDESIYKSHVDVGTQKDPHGNGCKDKTQARPARKSQANKKPILKNIQRFARHGKHRKHNGPYKVRHLGFAVKGNDEKQ